MQWLQDNQLAGVIGGSGGLYIIPAVLQVFLNHFILGMEPLAAVQSPRIYHKVLLISTTYTSFHLLLYLTRKMFILRLND